MAVEKKVKKVCYKFDAKTYEMIKEDSAKLGISYTAYLTMLVRQHHQER